MSSSPHLSTFWGTCVAFVSLILSFHTASMCHYSPCLTSKFARNGRVSENSNPQHLEQSIVVCGQSKLRQYYGLLFLENLIATHLSLLLYPISLKPCNWIMLVSCELKSQESQSMKPHWSRTSLNGCIWLWD